MIPTARERMQEWLLLLPSAIAWLLLVVEPGGRVHAALCSMATQGSSPPLLRGMRAEYLPALFGVDWALMLTAMMVPLLIAPVRHICERSFADRRLRSVALFVAGYFAIWMVEGFMLLPLTQGVLRHVRGWWIPLAFVTVVATIWQSSPMKQRCLNRNHAHTELAAFGWAADRDVLLFGWRHGFWCVGSCWALMLLPILVTRGHIAAMAVVTVWVFGERLDRPSRPRWQWRGPRTAVRIAVAQTRRKLIRI